MNIGSIQNRGIDGYKNQKHLPQNARSNFSALLNQAKKPENLTQPVKTDQPVQRQESISKDRYLNAPLRPVTFSKKCAKI